MRGVSVVEEQ